MNHFLALLKAEEVILRGMIRDAKSAYHSAKKTEREIMLLAREPWRVVTNGEPLGFTGATVRRMAVKAAASHTCAPDQRAAVNAAIDSVTESEWGLAARLNRAIKTQLMQALEVDGRQDPDPFLIERLKTLPCIVPGAFALNPIAAVDRLKELALNGGKRKPAGSREAEELRRQWFAINAALAEHGSGSSTNVRELMQMADRITGLSGGLEPASSSSAKVDSVKVAKSSAKTPRTAKATTKARTGESARGAADISPKPPMPGSSGRRLRKTTRRALPKATSAG